jgi:hypothetical protein
MRKSVFAIGLYLFAGVAALGFMVSAETSEYPEITGMLAGMALACLILMTVYFFAIAR